MLGERNCPICGNEGTRIVQSTEGKFPTFWLCEEDFPLKARLVKERTPVTARQKGWG